MATASPTTPQSIDRALRDAAIPERKAFAEGYMPTALELLGVPVPGIRTVLSLVLRSLKGSPRAEVLALADGIIACGTHEGRQLAYELLARHPATQSDLDADELERLGAGMDNWASVDTFGTHLAGQAWREGRLADQRVHRWAQSPDRWWRRAALVATVPLNLASHGGSGDTPRTLTMAERFVSERDPMLVKALSWSLRQLATTDPAATMAFMERHTDVLAPLVLRELKKKLLTGRKS